MVLKHSLSEVFRGKLPNPQKLFNILIDLDNRIDKGVPPRLTVKKNVKLTDESLKKAFGSKFKSIGVVHNTEGSYLIVADGKKFKQIALEDI